MAAGNFEKSYSSLVDVTLHEWKNISSIYELKTLINCVFSKPSLSVLVNANNVLFSFEGEIFFFTTKIATLFVKA